MSKQLDCFTSDIAIAPPRRITPAIVQSIHDKVHTAKTYNPPSIESIKVFARLAEDLRSEYAYLGKTDDDDIAGDARIDAAYISRAQRQINKSQLFLDENLHRETTTVQSARRDIYELEQAIAAVRQIARRYPAKRRHWDWGSLVLLPLKAGLEDMLGEPRGSLGSGNRGYFVQFAQEILPVITLGPSPKASTINREYQRQKPKDLPGLPSFVRPDGSREFTGDPSAWMQIFQLPKKTIVIRGPTGDAK